MTSYGMMARMEFLLQILFACPKCWRVFGGLLVSVSSSFLFAGLAMMRRVDRVETRAGASISQLVEQALASVPLPTTALGFAFAAFCVVLGLGLVSLSKQIEKF